MKQLDEIIDLASSDSCSVSTLLRKCLVLASILKSEELKTWAHHELNGYDFDDPAMPEYRKTSAPAKGMFLGVVGTSNRKPPLRTRG